MKHTFVQEVKFTSKPYCIVITMPSYPINGGDEDATAQYNYAEYENALNEYRFFISEQAKHIAMIDTSRIIGLYRTKEDGTFELRKQVILDSYDQFSNF